MNKVILIGRLTRDPEYSATEDWTPVCTFTLAVPREYKDAEGKRPADFFRIVAWRDLADTVQKHCHRGDRLAVYGSAQIYTRENEEGEKFTRLNIFAAKISFLGKAAGGPPQLERTSKPKMEPIMESNPFDEV